MFDRTQSLKSELDAAGLNCIIDPAGHRTGADYIVCSSPDELSGLSFRIAGDRVKFCCHDSNSSFSTDEMEFQSVSHAVDTWDSFRISMTRNNGA